MASPNILVKKSLDEWLDEVDYSYLNSGHYMPSKFALRFMNFVKMVNGDEGESHKTPVMHLAMLDKIQGKSSMIVNLCYRGSGKTTIFMEYLNLYLGVFGAIDGFGDVPAMIYVSDSMDNGVKSARKNIEFRWKNSEFLQKWLPHKDQIVTDNYIEWNCTTGNRFATKMFGAKTGLRGTKMFGKRPVLAVLDDLMSDDDARSKTSLEAIKDTIDKGVSYALDPTHRKVIFNGTPFRREDPIIEAVESGVWSVNVWPVCEKFPCEREEFRGAWEERFSYDTTFEDYEKKVHMGRGSSFYQEMMLRISTADERLVQDDEIRWYSRPSLLNNRGRYNFYITTDFATSDSETADLSTVSVWAYNANGDWFWVDGFAEKQTMDKTIDGLFSMVSEYRPQQVGIEITGQQYAFIQWIQQQMMERNIWFNFASDGTKPGIRPTTNKLRRFNQVVPLFKAGKIYYPEEMKSSKVVQEHMTEIRMATHKGLKGKDDCLDTISMLLNLKPWKPTEDMKMVRKDQHWGAEDDDDDDDMMGGAISSYIV